MLYAVITQQEDITVRIHAKVVNCSLKEVSRNDFTTIAEWQAVVQLTSGTEIAANTPE